jgi:hypothetical protein
MTFAIPPSFWFCLQFDQVSRGQTDGGRCARRAALQDMIIWDEKLIWPQNKSNHLLGIFSLNEAILFRTTFQ